MNFPLSNGVTIIGKVENALTTNTKNKISLISLKKCF